MGNRSRCGELVGWFCEAGNRVAQQTEEVPNPTADLERPANQTVESGRRPEHREIVFVRESKSTLLGSAENVLGKVHRIVESKGDYMYKYEKIHEYISNVLLN